MTAPYPHTLIRASAGTGKTYALSNRFLGLLIHGVPLDEILAVTFTRKAAGEILDRVLLRLAEAAGNPARCEELAKAVVESGASSPKKSSKDARPARFDQSRARALLGEVVRNLHRLRIGTLDSFFSQLASSFGLELGLPVDWRIIEPLEEKRLRDAAIENILQDHDTRDTAQLVHLLTKGEPKRSIVDLIRDTVSGLHAILLDAEPEAWDKLPRVKIPDAAEVEESIRQWETFPATLKSQVKSIQESANLARVGDWTGLLSKGIPKCILSGQQTYSRSEIPAELWGLGERLVRHARSFLLTELALQTSATGKLLKRYDEAYQRRRRAARAMQFDDVTRSLASASSEAGLGRDTFRLDTFLNHVMLDEFQDTSPIQWKVLRPFVQRAVRGVPTEPGTAAGKSRASAAGTFFCVGDVKQAIYGWRGGSSAIFDVVAGEVPDLVAADLAMSYRSSPPVIEMVNRVFQNLTKHQNLERYAGALARWETRFPQHTTARSELPGYACLLTAARDPALEEDDTACLMRTAAQKVAEIVTRAPGASVAVLTRKNENVARVIFELGQLGIQASEEGGNPLSDSAAVQLILSLFRLADHPGDSAARFHVARSPLAKLVGLEVTDGDRAAEKLARRLRRELAVGGYGHTVETLVQALLPCAGRRDRARLMQLVELAYDYQPQATLRPHDFVRQVESQRVPDPSSTDVRVTTIHKSKGLQFDVVVLPEWEGALTGEAPPVVVGRADPTSPIDRICRYRAKELQALLPAEFQQLFDDHLERTAQETLCVMYVALTRAIHAAYLIIAPTSTSKNKASSDLPKTMAGVLRAALTDGQPLAEGTVAFECGDPTWLEKRPRPKRIEEAAPGGEPPQGVPLGKAVVPHPGPIAFAKPRTELRRREATSPSQLEGGPTQDAAGILRLENAGALARGTIIHAWFEQIAWLDEGLPSSEELRRIAAQLPNSGLDLRQLEAQFRDMLRRDDVAESLTRRHYDPARNREFRKLLGPRSFANLRLEVKREQRILSVLDDQLLGGAIDRLVLVFAGDELLACDVLDFKTDAFALGDTAAREARREFYAPQLAAYRQAVSSMFRLPMEQITTHLLFVGTH